MRLTAKGISWCLALLLVVGGICLGDVEEREESLKNTSGLERLRLLNQLVVDYLYSAPDKSLAYAREAVQLGENLDEPEELFTALNRIGNWYFVNHRHEDAVAYYLRALELEPRLDNKRLVANVLTNIGMVYWELGNFQAAEEYHTRALELRNKVGYTPGEMGVTLNNLGLAAEGKGDFSKALEYYNAALVLHRQAGNKRRVAAALTNINNVYAQNGDYHSALKYLWQSISAYREAGYPRGAANSSLGAGNAYIYLEEYEKALPYLESALETAKKINDEDLLRDISRSLSIIYEKQGDFNTAFQYHRDYGERKRKLLEQRNEQHVSVMKITYETEKKERELQLLRETKRGERMIYIFLAAAVLLVAALPVVFYFRYVTGKRLNRGLRAREAKYRAIFDRAGDAVFLVDGTTVIDCNEKTPELFGYSREEVIGRTFTDFAPTTQPDGRHSIETGMELIEKTLQGELQRFYWLHCKKDGTPIHAEINLSPVTIHGKPMAQFIIHDTGKRELLEDQRIKTAKLETVGVLAGGIAHDFNNLLAVIKGNLEMAKMRIPPGHGAVTFLSRLETALHSAEELSETFLSIAEGDSLSMETTAVDGLIRDSVRAVLAESRAGAECRIKIPGDLWMVDCDEIQIKQLTRNIVQNAVDALAAAGGGRMEVVADHVVLPDGDAAALPAGRYIRVTVWDGGEGIPPEHLPKIFDPYFTTRSESDCKRAGMGLTVARAIVKRHGGALTVSSTEGEGTTCRIYLPASQWVL